MTEEYKRPDPCEYCKGAGFLRVKRETLAEELDKCFPCFACEGHGNPVDARRGYQHIDNVVIKEVSQVKLNPDTLCPRRRITVEFDYNYEAQQDGRPPKPHHVMAAKCLEIGKKVYAALKAKSQQSLRDAFDV